MSLSRALCSYSIGPSSQLFSAMEALLSQTLETFPPDTLASGLAPAAPLFTELATGFPHSTLELLVPALLSTAHAFTAALLDLPPSADSANPPDTAARSALLVRLAAVLSLAHLSLPSVDALSASPPNAGRVSRYAELHKARDTLVRLVAASGVDTQLAALSLPSSHLQAAAQCASVDVESAALGLLERVWDVCDALEVDEGGAATGAG